PTLLLASGQALLPAGAAQVSGTTTLLRYLVPLAGQPRLSQWIVTPPDGQPALRWQIILIPPPPRSEVLRGVLLLTDATIQPGTAGTTNLVIALHNIGATPLALRADDLTLVRAGDQAPLAIPSTALAALQRPLQPGERRPLSIPLPTTTDPL